MSSRLPVNLNDLLHHRNLAEGRSTGISKILKVMEENGSGKPDFETDDDRSYFLVRLPVHPNENLTPKVDEITSVKTSVGVSEYASEKMSEKILKEVRNNSKVTIAVLAEHIGVTTPQ